MTKRTRSRVQAAEISFVRRLGSPQRQGEKLWHPGGAQSRGAAPPHREESNEVVWASRMPTRRLPGEAFRTRPTGRRPPGRLRTRWRDRVFRQAWERPGWMDGWMDGHTAELCSWCLTRTQFLPCWKGACDWLASAVNQRRAWNEVCGWLVLAGQA